jgi:hypothetical protein
VVAADELVEADQEELPLLARSRHATAEQVSKASQIEGQCDQTPNSVRKIRLDVMSISADRIFAQLGVVCRPRVEDCAADHGYEQSAQSDG